MIGRAFVRPSRYPSSIVTTNVRAGGGAFASMSRASWATVIECHPASTRAVSWASKISGETLRPGSASGASAASAIRWYVKIGTWKTRAPAGLRLPASGHRAPTTRATGRLGGWLGTLAPLPGEFEADRWTGGTDGSCGAGLVVTEWQPATARAMSRTAAIAPLCRVRGTRRATTPSFQRPLPTAGQREPNAPRRRLDIGEISIPKQKATDFPGEGNDPTAAP